MNKDVVYQNMGVLSHAAMSRNHGRYWEQHRRSQKAADRDACAWLLAWAEAWTIERRNAFLAGAMSLRLPWYPNIPRLTR